MSTNDITERLPPHDTDLEAAFLGCLLIGSDTVISDVLAGHSQLGSYFYDLKHLAVFNAIRDLTDGAKPVNTISVCGLLKQRGAMDDAGQMVYVGTLADKAAAGGLAVYYVEKLQELFIKRRAIFACQQVIADAFSDKPTSALLDTLERELNGICSENAPNESDIRRLVQSTIDTIEVAHKNDGKPQGVTTGFAELDTTTHGLRGGQLVVIGARPGIGKTSLVANIAEHASVDLKLSVGFVELEMTAEELTMRLLASRSGVAMDKLLNGELDAHDFSAVTVAAAAIAKAPLHIADEAGITISQLKAKARRMHRRYNLKLLIVDYLQLIRPSRPNASRNVEVSEVSSSLKALAKELNLPIIALSQLNRDSDTDNREPRLRDLRDSGSIEQDADIVGLLHRANPGEAKVQLHLAKHRQGATRKMQLLFCGELFRFRSIGPGDIV